MATTLAFIGTVILLVSSAWPPPASGAVTSKMCIRNLHRLMLIYCGDCSASTEPADTSQGKRNQGVGAKPAEIRSSAEALGLEKFLSVCCGERQCSHEKLRQFCCV